MPASVRRPSSAMWRTIDQAPKPSSKCHATIRYETDQFSGHVFGPSKTRVLRFADELFDPHRWDIVTRWSEISKMAYVSGRRVSASSGKYP